MKPSQDNTPYAPLTTSSDVIRWYASLQELHTRLAPYFARPEPFARALRFVQGILSEVPRKNGWQLAEQAREETPYGMQRLLSQAVWNEDGVRDEIRAFALQTLGNKQAIVAIDDTGFLKRGKHSAGVGKQYYGPTGDVRNCQSGVLLSLVTEAGHILIDRELYLLSEWTDDPARCRRAGIPETVPFRTKPELAILMLERLKSAQVSVDWVVADSGYGGNPELRDWLETKIQPIVLAIACDEPVVLEIPKVGVRRLEVRDVPAYLSASDWQRLSMSEGTKGPRLFDWACLPIWHQDGDDGWHSLLLRRTLDRTPELTFYLVFAPPGTSLQAKVTALGGRWRIEEDIENSKDLGLDHYEVRTYVGWYRYYSEYSLRS
jgi:SRSO17 transposase